MRLRVLAAGLLVAGCGAADKEEEPVSSTASEMLLCDAFTRVNEDGSEYTDHERYVLPAINRKLRNFPALASTLGSRTVTDCVQARRFVEIYGDYATRHPGFDEQEEVDPAESNDPGPYPGAPPVLEMPRLLNGTATFNYPVVRLASNRGATCSGFFIAKNWIVTSAHCLAYQDPDAPRTRTQPISGWYPYRIDRAATNGTIASTASLTGHLLQYPHPDWFGWNPSQPLNLAPVNDIGLLYVDAVQFDALLPPTPANSALRISARAPTATQTLTQFGWGPGTLGPPLGPTNTLRRGNFIPTSVELQTLRWTVPASLNPSPCVGDSGGPAARLVTINGVTQWIAVGALGGNTTSTTVPCGRSGDSIGWPRMDDFRVRNFINRTLQIWNGAKFACLNFSLTGTGPADYSRCWGTPCSSNVDCASTHNCRALVSGRPEIKGQCLPKAGAGTGGLGP